MEDAKINNSGVYTGIGATAKNKKDRIIITEPFQNYPADKAGLKAGDEIIKIGSIKVSDFKEDAGELLKGAPGSKVELTFLRQGEIKNTVLTRETIDVRAVPFSKLIQEDIGLHCSY